MALPSVCGCYCARPDPGRECVRKRQRGSFGSREREALVNAPLIVQVDRVHSARGAGSLGELCRDDSRAGSNIKDFGTKERAFLLEDLDDLLGLSAPRVEVRQAWLDFSRGLWSMSFVSRFGSRLEISPSAFRASGSCRP